MYDVITQALDITLESQDVSAEQKEAFRVLVLAEVYRNKGTVLEELAEAGLLTVEE